MTDLSNPHRPDGDGLLPDEMEHVLGFVSDASVAIHDEPLVVWVDSEGEWWGGLPQSFIKLSDHNWTVDRWEPLPTRDDAEGAGERLMPLSDINDLDDVCRELGIQDSHVTPAEAVRELNEEIERMRVCLAAASKPAPDAMREALKRIKETVLFAQQSRRTVVFDSILAITNAALLGISFEDATALSAPVPSPDGALTALRDICDLEPGTQEWIDRCTKEPATSDTELLGRIFLVARAARDFATRPSPAVATFELVVEPLYASPPVRGDRELLAETIHKARYRPDRTPQPFANEDAHGREYCFRLADAILSLPVQSGAWERAAIAEACVRRLAHCNINNPGQREMAADDILSTLQKIEAAGPRQAPHSSREPSK